MDEKKFRKQIHYAIDAHLPPYTGDPYRVQRILNTARKTQAECHAEKKKVSAGMVFALVLIMLSLTCIR